MQVYARVHVVAGSCVHITGSVIELTALDQPTVLKYLERGKTHRLDLTRDDGRGAVARGGGRFVFVALRNDLNCAPSGLCTLTSELCGPAVVRRDDRPSFSRRLRRATYVRARSCCPCRLGPGCVEGPRDPPQESGWMITQQ